MADPFKLAFTDPDALQEQIEEYFESLKTERILTQWSNGEPTEIREPYMRPPTMAGLADFLGVVRNTLLNYRKRSEKDDPIAPVIVRALNRIAAWNEEALYTRETVTGAQFSLRFNHGYEGEERPPAEEHAYEMRVIPPADGAARKAIPKWEGDE